MPFVVRHRFRHDVRDVAEIQSWDPHLHKLMSYLSDRCQVEYSWAFAAFLHPSGRASVVEVVFIPLRLTEVGLLHLHRQAGTLELLQLLNSHLLELPVLLVIQLR